ncbi:MAG: glycosyltransferase [Candidatus Neomarinimicrobiota bacterium]|nr:glycosyltransferase [Candidatus Neomarinimicrobiota bacterium]
MTAFLTLTVGLYGVLLLFFTLGLYLTKEKKTDRQPFVTVVIPARNEKEHIETVLHDVTHQTYPINLYEIIVVDDESEDITPNLVRVFAERHPNLRLLSSADGDPNLKYKKRPLDVGIRAASGEIILQTDADCRVTSRWIETMVSYFTPKVGMVIGHSQIEANGSTAQHVEALDFLMLSATGRSTSQYGSPFAATGQNLAFLKEAFLDVGGFSPFADALGGDDTFLLQSIRKESSWEVVSALNEHSFSRTLPCESFKSFISQRVRWASDSLYFREANPLFFFVIVTTFLANFMALVSLAGLIIGTSSFENLINVLIFKFLAEGYLMARATKVFDRRDLRPAFLPWFFFQMPYVVYMGIVTIVGRSQGWGGRNVV